MVGGVASRDPLEVLLALTRLLAEETSLEKELQATTDAALEVLPADHASLRLFDDERRELLSSARSGTGQGKAPATFKAGEGVLGIVADTGKAALVLDTSTDERFKHASVGFDVGSLVAVPLVASGQVVGVLSASAAEPGCFSELHRDLAQLLANCTVPAIESARLAHLAITDDLTRAYNYRYLGSRLGEETSRARRYGDSFGVLLMDLDHFKRVNDRYGHPVGDEVLRGFADRVRAEVREPDVLIRRGGEEFVLLMPSTTLPEATAVAERIRASVADEAIETGAGPVSVTVSVGVATWRTDEEGASVESRADAALYRAKEGGRDRVVTDPNLDESHSGP